MRRHRDDSAIDRFLSLPDVACIEAKRIAKTMLKEIGAEQLGESIATEANEPNMDHVRFESCLVDARD